MDSEILLFRGSLFTDMMNNPTKLFLLVGDFNPKAKKLYESVVIKRWGYYLTCIGNE